MGWIPRLVRLPDEGDRQVVLLGHRLVDNYLEFLAARARPNTVVSCAFDLKVQSGDLVVVEFDQPTQRRTRVSYASAVSVSSNHTFPQGPTNS